MRFLMQSGWKRWNSRIDITEMEITSFLNEMLYCISLPSRNMISFLLKRPYEVKNISGVSLVFMLFKMIWIVWNYYKDFVLFLLNIPQVLQQQTTFCPVGKLQRKSLNISPSSLTGMPKVRVQHCKLQN